MSGPLRVALAGLGTVGAGVVKLIEVNRTLVERRAARPIQVVAVSARDRNRDRGIDMSKFEWVDDPVTLAARDDIDVVVELIGGSDGPALALARATLESGKALVTANKARSEEHTSELQSLMRISYAVFCLKKKKPKIDDAHYDTIQHGAR